MTIELVESRTSFLRDSGEVRTAMMRLASAFGRKTQGKPVQLKLGVTKAQGNAR